jgi:hypothetical protein
MHYSIITTKCKFPNHLIPTCGYNIWEELDILYYVFTLSALRYSNCYY